MKSKRCLQEYTKSALGALPQHRGQVQRSTRPVLGQYRISLSLRLGSLFLLLVISSIYLWDSGIIRHENDTVLQQISGTKIEHMSTRKPLSRPSKFHRRPLHPGKPLEPDSLSHPPLIEKTKIMGKLAKLDKEALDTDEDWETTADSLELFGIFRWPPLISQVPSSPGLTKEEYSSQTADIIFCSMTPCKLLLPAWTEPLSPSKVSMQLQELLKLASGLNRTLVLPNAGLVYTDNEERLLGLGSCHRYPIARYFDITSIMPTKNKQCDFLGAKSVVPFSSFIEWVKYRPSNPTAQMITISSQSQDNDFSLSYEFGNSEIIFDDQAEKGQGKHKNCLASKASKLKFGESPSIIISPKKPYPLSSQNHPTLLVEEEGDGPETTYFEDFHDFLASQELVLEDFNQVVVNKVMNMRDHDILVVEWELEPSAQSSLDYSPRLSEIASSMVSALPRPLITIRSGIPEIDSEDLPHVRTCQGLDTLLEIIDLVDQKKVLKNVTETIGLGISNGTVEGDINGKETEGVINDLELGKYGTIWLEEGLQLDYTSLTELLARNPKATPSPTIPDQEPLHLTSEILGQVMENFHLVNLTSSITQLKERSLYLKAGLDDPVFLIILGELIAKNADLVLSLSCNA